MPILNDKFFLAHHRQWQMDNISW